MNATYELYAGYLLNNELRVIGFKGSEAISAPYEFVIDVVSDLDLVTLQFAVLSQSAFMRWEIEGYDSEFVFGVIQSVEALGHNRSASAASTIAAVIEVVDDWTIATAPGGRSGRLSRFRLTLVPRLDLLKHRKNSRVFERLTTREIVDRILTEHSVTARWTAGCRVETRTYTVQYKETDFEFVNRLLAEEGIYYFFEHPSIDWATLESSGSEVSSRLRELLSANDVDGIGAWSPARDLGSETVIFAADCDYPAIASGSELESIQSPTGAPVLSYFDAAAVNANPREETLDVFEWKRILTTDCVTISETQLIDAVSSHATTNGHYEDKRTASEGLMSMARTLAPSATSMARTSLSSVKPVMQLLASLSPAISRSLRETYEHSEKWDGASAAAPASRRLQAARREKIVGLGKSAVQRLRSGYQFCLDHTTPEINADYVLTRVRHRVESSDQGGPDHAEYRYSNEFECVPSSVLVRPDRKEFAVQQILESATVVGNGDLDTNDDAHAGCVRIRFHWDRSDPRVESNQCWVPVMQPWAGSSFGFQFVPRVGMEVLVGFLAGSASSPVILGSRHNQVAQPPFFLPDQLTQSGIRTKSFTPESEEQAPSDRFNQLRFEDRHGSECAELFSSGNVQVLADQNAILKARETVNVVSSRFESDTSGDYLNSVGRNVIERINGSRTNFIRGDFSETVMQSSVTHVMGYRSEFVDRDFDQNVLGAVTERISGSRTAVIMGDNSVRIDGDHDMHSKGEMTLTSRAGFTMKAPDIFTIECGESTITMTPDEIVFSSPSIRTVATKEVSLDVKDASVRFTDGKVVAVTKDAFEVYSKAIELNANDASLDLSPDGAKISAAKAAAMAGDTVTLGSKGAGVKLDTVALLEGSQVSLKSGGNTASNFKKKVGNPDATEDAFVLATQILAPGGKPVAHQWVNVLDSETHQIVAGPVQTDDQGELRVEVPEDRHYDVEFVDALRCVDGVSDDHDSTCEIHARFVDHRGVALDGLKVSLSGETLSIDVVTDVDGVLTEAVPSGPYTLDVEGTTFHVHAMPIAERTREKLRPFVFVIEPAEAEGIAHDVRANRVSASTLDLEE